MGKKSKKDKNINNTDNTMQEEKKENIIDFYKGFSPSSDKNIPFPAPYKLQNVYLHLGWCFYFYIYIYKFELCFFLALTNERNMIPFSLSS